MPTPPEAHDENANVQSRREITRRAWNSDTARSVADLHPEIVQQIMAKIEAEMKTFPPNILQDWETTKVKKVSPTPAGALPHSID